VQIISEAKDASVQTTVFYNKSFDRYLKSAASFVQKGKSDMVLPFSVDFKAAL